MLINFSSVLAQGSSSSTGGVESLVAPILFLVIAIVVIAGLWKMFEKAGQPGWGAIVPIYNLYLMCKIAGRPGWWVLLMFIPIVSLVFAIIIAIDIAKSFGKGIGFGIGLIFLGFIFYPILGFGDAQYQGPAAGNEAQQRPGPLSMASKLLPDPQWSESAAICVLCGYSLAGLPGNGQCPECGAPYEARQLILSGVPRNSSAGTGARRFYWVVLMTVSILFIFLWGVLLILSIYVLAGAIVALAASYIAMLVTGPRERRGTERFIIVPEGIARVAANFDPGSRKLDTVFLPWGSSNIVVLTRIGPVWRRIRVGRLDSGAGGPLRDVIFDAGIRCPDDAAEIVRATINGHLAMNAHFPMTPPKAPGS